MWDITRFAWLPVKLSDGHWCWLARVTQRQRFEADESGWSRGHWVPVGPVRRAS